jgi:sec-independent protein translocase protein TatA
MFKIGPMEMILIVGIALVIFGPAKLPELGKALGKGIREFKTETSNLMGDSAAKENAADKK